MKGSRDQAARLLKNSIDNYFVANEAAGFSWQGKQYECLCGEYETDDQFTVVQLIRGHETPKEDGLQRIGSIVVTLETTDMLMRDPRDVDSPYREEAENDPHDMYLVDTRARPYELDPDNAPEPLMANRLEDMNRTDISYIGRVLRGTTFYPEAAFLLALVMRRDELKPGIRVTNL